MEAIRKTEALLAPGSTAGRRSGHLMPINRPVQSFIQGEKQMNSLAQMAGKQIRLAAVMLAFIPAIALGQDKAGMNAPAATSTPGQPANSATGVDAPKETAGPTAKANANNDARGKQKAGVNPPAALILIPLNAPEQNQWKKKGCWAKFFDDQNYKGDNLTLLGPVDMADMTGPFGIDWKGKISSVETGPKARVMVYDNENFKDLVATFKPGQKSPDVSKKMGFFDEFSSVKIVCDNIKASDAKKNEAGNAGKP